MLGKDFIEVSAAAVLDTTLRLIGFCFPLLGYFEERVPRFINIIDEPNITINPVKPILDSKDEKIRRKEKFKAKRKMRLRALMWARVVSSAALFFSPPRSPPPVSGFRSLALLSFGPRSPAFASNPGFLAPVPRSGSTIPASCLRSLALEFCPIPASST